MAEILLRAAGHRSRRHWARRIKAWVNKRTDGLDAAAALFGEKFGARKEGAIKTCSRRCSRSSGLDAFGVKSMMLTKCEVNNIEAGSFYLQQY